MAYTLMAWFAVAGFCCLVAALFQVQNAGLAAIGCFAIVILLEMRIKIGESADAIVKAIREKP